MLYTIGFKSGNEEISGRWVKIIKMRSVTVVEHVVHTAVNDVRRQELIEDWHMNGYHHEVSISGIAVSLVRKNQLFLPTIFEHDLVKIEKPVMIYGMEDNPFGAQCVHVSVIDV